MQCSGEESNQNKDSSLSTSVTCGRVSLCSGYRCRTKAYHLRSVNPNICISIFHYNLPPAPASNQQYMFQFAAFTPAPCNLLVNLQLHLISLKLSSFFYLKCPYIRTIIFSYPTVSIKINWFEIALELFWNVVMNHRFFYPRFNVQELWPTEVPASTLAQTEVICSMFPFKRLVGWCYGWLFGGRISHLQQTCAVYT